jgi:hypothetical protein
MSTKRFFTEIIVFFDKNMAIATLERSIVAAADVDPGWAPGRFKNAFRGLRN